LGAVVEDLGDAVDEEHPPQPSNGLGAMQGGGHVEGESVAEADQETIGDGEKELPKGEVGRDGLEPAKVDYRRRQREAESEGPVTVVAYQVEEAEGRHHSGGGHEEPQQSRARNDRRGDDGDGRTDEREATCPLPPVSGRPCTESDGGDEGDHREEQAFGDHEFDTMMRASTRLDMGPSRCGDPSGTYLGDNPLLTVSLPEEGISDGSRLSVGHLS